MPPRPIPAPGGCGPGRRLSSTRRNPSTQTPRSSARRVSCGRDGGQSQADEHASGSGRGVRYPERYGRASNPLLPAGIGPASFNKSSNETFSVSGGYINQRARRQKSSKKNSLVSCTLSRWPNRIPIPSTRAQTAFHVRLSIYAILTT
mgnify:CR=1 FL=1